MRRIGSKSGSERVTVAVNELPPHRHTWAASGDLAQDTSPEGHTTATVTGPSLYGSGTPIPMSPLGTTTTGGGGPHPNLMPSQCLNFIVSLVGIYPSRQ